MEAEKISEKIEGNLDKNHRLDLESSKCSESGMDAVGRFKNSPVKEAAQHSPIDENFNPNMKLTDPIFDNVVQIISIENRKGLESCSESLKTILSRDTPLKEKLEMVEIRNIVNQIGSLSSSNQDFMEAKFHVSPRITQSQSRRGSLANFSINHVSPGDVNSEQASSNSGISSRLAEIGEACGFLNRSSQGTGRKQGARAKKGGPVKSQ
ncbi:hypothetical protein L2E82_18235 [Cichorium intybus]|uniref:Uncharacterized protein n=1 Tax=Cichorium intybus TaxID=13427 RepID=A0ACB9F912_CICIN|nr:hypothetical protein L2E82_18235 [Cichorium intybus]